tara:strand:- start:1512 stop:2234 length:723 start_codon:yes stop_codon:yes gene_type:complete
MQNHVITDFSQTFERQTGLTMEYCLNIVEDTQSTFHSFSYLIKHLFSLIYQILPCQSLIIKNLTTPQRRNFYIELSKIDIKFNKNRYIDDNNNNCTDIRIFTDDFWSIRDYRTTPECIIYQRNADTFNEFYRRIGRDTVLTNHYFNVSMGNFLKFKRILELVHRRDTIIQDIDNQNNIIDNQNYIINDNWLHPSRLCCQLGISHNTKIKHYLADLIFDIKDNLTDAMYKEILEKISLISS